MDNTEFYNLAKEKGYSTLEILQMMNLRTYGKIFCDCMAEAGTMNDEIMCAGQAIDILQKYYKGRFENLKIETIKEKIISLMEINHGECATTEDFLIEDIEDQINYIEEYRQR